MAEANFVVNQEMLNLFWYYIRERYAIQRRRFVEKLPPPWTTDSALADWHYCSTHREDDRGTRFLQEVLTHCSSRSDKLYNIAVFRLLGSDVNQFRDLMGLNRSLTVDFHTPELIWKWAENRVQSGLRAMGHGAYLPPAPSFDSAQQTKIQAIILTTVKYVGDNTASLEKSVAEANTMQEVYDTFLAIPGCGSFYSQELGQDCLDARITKFDTEGNWTNAGPGAERGLRLIFPEIKTSELEDGIRWLVARHDYKSLGLPKPLTLRNCEHNLCELFKFNRARTGGRNRRRYKPNPLPLPNPHGEYA